MKKSFSRALSLLLVLVMILGVMPMAAADALLLTVTADDTALSMARPTTTVSVAEPTPENAANYNDPVYSWSVSDSTNSSVTGSTRFATFTAIETGEYTVTCTATFTKKSDAPEGTTDLVYSGSVEINVTRPNQSGVNVTAADDEVPVGGTLGLTAVAAPEGAALASVTWAVKTGSDKVTLSATSGATTTVTGVAEGEATITATSGSFTKDFTLTVTPEAVVATAADIAVRVGQTTTAAPTVTYTPALPSGAAPTYSYSVAADPTIAEVNTTTGLVKGLKAGSTTFVITIGGTGVTGVADKTIDCKVTVGAGTVSVDSYSGQASSGANTATLAPKYSDSNVEVDWKFTETADRGDYNVNATTGVVSGTGVGGIQVKVEAFMKGTQNKLAEGFATVTFYAYNNVKVTMPEGATEMKLGDSRDIEEAGSLLDWMLVSYNVSGVKADTDNIFFSGLRDTEGTFGGNNFKFDKSATVSGARLVEFTIGAAGEATFSYEVKAHDLSDAILCMGSVTIDYDGALASVEYSTTYDKDITFSEADFYEFWESAKQDSKLDYVQFTINSTYPAYGTLYTSTTSTSATYKATSTHKFYYGSYSSGTNNKDLGSLTYVPSSLKTNTFDVVIPFTAYGEIASETVSGNVVIHMNEATNAISSRGIFFGTEYDTKNDLTYADQMADAFTAKTGKVLESVIFSMPAAEKATLYYKVPTNAAGNTLVAQGTKLPSGTRLTVKSNSTTGIATTQLKNVALIPAAGFSGSLTVTFTGYAADSSSGTTCTITFDVKTKTASAVFSDVTSKSYSWASDSVDFLYYEGTAQGSNGKYNPKANITRGDFMLMLYRAFLEEDYGTFNVTTNFPDVVKGTSTYSKETYQAVGVAKYLGIAQGTNDRFNPKSNITRQEAMVLIYRTLDTLGRELDYSSGIKATSFKDYTKVSSWAATAITNLVAHGVVTGTNDNINPLANITRAEMACILHRVITY